MGVLEDVEKSLVDVARILRIFADYDAVVTFIHKRDPAPPCHAQGCQCNGFEFRQWRDKCALSRAKAVCNRLTKLGIFKGRMSPAFDVDDVQGVQIELTKPEVPTSAVTMADVITHKKVIGRMTQLVKHG